MEHSTDDLYLSQTPQTGCLASTAREGPDAAGEEEGTDWHRPGAAPPVIGDTEPLEGDACTTCGQPRQGRIWMPLYGQGVEGWRTFRMECDCEAREREEAEARAAEQRQRAARDRQQRAVAAHLWVPQPPDPRLSTLEKALLGKPATVGLRTAQTYARRAPRGSDMGAHFVCSCRRRAELYARALLADHRDAGAIVGALRLTLWLDDAAGPDTAESFIPRREAAATVEVLALLEFGDQPGEVAALQALGNLLQRRLDARLTTHAAGPRSTEQWLREFSGGASIRRRAAERVAELMALACRTIIDPTQEPRNDVDPPA